MDADECPHLNHLSAFIPFILFIGGRMSADADRTTIYAEPGLTSEGFGIRSQYGAEASRC